MHIALPTAVLVTALALGNAGLPTPAAAADPGDFISTWNTGITSAGSSGPKQIRLPLKSDGTGVYDFTVSWGDGTSSRVTEWYDAEHTYATAGNYTITISGLLQGWAFSNTGDRLKISSVAQWGDVNFGNGAAFMGAANLTSNASDSPDLTGVTSLAYYFALAEKLNGGVSGWDTSQITNMRGVFWRASSFNQSLSNWDTSSVTDMKEMFSEARAFNRDISAWDTSSVTTMSGMFSSASAFNRPLGNWDTSSVTDMSSMFNGATNFNSDISGWDVSQVADMSMMFANAEAFNAPIGDWNTSQVQNLREMFLGASSFNQPLANWDTSQVVGMQGMFGGANDFNQPIGSWNTANVTDMSRMFQQSSFNQPLDMWDTSNVSDMSMMFLAARDFDQPIGDWDTSRVVTMDSMFAGAYAFDQDIGGWDVSQVTSMEYTFGDALSFNQDIGGWDVGQVTDMSQMFNRALAFDQDIGGWDVSQVSSMGMMFLGVRLSLTHYDALLNGWASLPSLTDGVEFGGGLSRYTLAGKASRDTLTGTRGWDISDGGIALPGFGAVPSSLAFDDPVVGTTSAARTVTITNTGEASLTFPLEAVSVEGSSAARYDIISDTCSAQSIMPQATCAIGVTFTPNAVGVAPAHLSITTNALQSPHSIGLLGKGVEIPTAPINVLAEPGFRQALVDWTAPDSTGGDEIIDYRVTATPGGSACESTTTTCTVEGLQDGATYTFTVKARNSAGYGPASAPSAPITLAGDIAVARLVASPDTVLSESTVLFDASASSSLSGQITTFEWRAEGGDYELGGPTYQRSWPTPGIKNVSVRVTGQGGTSDTASVQVRVLPKSQREPGLSINGGSPYTNKREVTLSLGWPDGAREVRVSNDGGFEGTPTVDLSNTMVWLLDDSVSGAFTKVVYVRFKGDGIDQTRTYSDDIILDTTPPVISSATAVKGDAAAASLAASTRAGKGHKVSYTVRVRANDRLSGVRTIRVNTKRKTTAATVARYRKRVMVQLKPGKRLFVQVRDGAGNWTDWKRVVTRART